MAEIVKLKKLEKSGVSTTLYPLTLTPSVIDPDTGKSVRQELDEIEHLKVFIRDNWYNLNQGDFDDIVSLTAEEYELLSTADIVLIDGQLVTPKVYTDIPNEETGEGTISFIDLLNVVRYYSDNFLIRDYRVWKQSDSTGKIQILKSELKYLNKHDYPLSVKMETGSFALSYTVSNGGEDIDITKPFFIDVQLGRIFYEENGEVIDVGGVLYFSTNEWDHPQVAEIWEEVGCRANSTTRIKCTPILENLCEIESVNADGVMSKQWVDLSLVTKMAFLLYTFNDIADSTIPFQTEGTFKITIYRNV